MRLSVCVVLLVWLSCLSGTWAQGETGGGRQVEDRVGGDSGASDRQVERQVTDDGQTVHDIWTELQGLRYKVQSMEAKVEDLEKENSALTARLTASETTVDELKARTTALHTRLSASETELTRETTERPKVAFSASLPSGKRGRFTTETKLVYSRVFTNRSKAYNSVTGVFTAPVRGVYDFRFTAYDNPNPDGYSIDVYMYKNGMRITTISTYGTTASTAVSLELEVGDTVYLRLPANGRLNDYADNRNIFSGFLLFPL